MLPFACIIEWYADWNKLHILYLNSYQCCYAWLSGQLLICLVEGYGGHRNLQSRWLPCTFCALAIPRANVLVSPHKVSLRIWPNVIEPFCIMCCMMSFMWYTVAFIGGKKTMNNALLPMISHYTLVIGFGFLSHLVVWWRDMTPFCILFLPFLEICLHIYVLAHDYLQYDDWTQGHVKVFVVTLLWVAKHGCQCQ